MATLLYYQVRPHLLVPETEVEEGLEKVHKRLRLYVRNIYVYVCIYLYMYL